MSRFLLKAGAALTAWCLISPPQGAFAADRPLVPAASAESVGFAPDRIRRLDAAMGDVVKRGEVAGMVTLLARHGKIVDYQAFGQAAKGPMPKDEIFRIYSMTKPITGAAMMILYEEGRWKLDDPVTKYVPELAGLTVFKSVGADGQAVTEPVKRSPTMRELMSHTAGFGYGLADNNYVDQQFRAKKVLSSQGLKQMVDRIATIPLKTQPGERWIYSAAVDIQGLIVERLSGMSFGEFLKQRIFTPLKMRDTGFSVPPAQGARLTPIYYFDKTGHLVDATQLGIGGSPVPDFTKAPAMESGGGGLVSTATDYARFCQMMLNGGELDGVRILAPATVKLMATNALPEGVTLTTDGTNAQKGNTATGFGLDFAVIDRPAGAGVLQGKGTFYWGGAAGTWFWIDPTDDVVFVGMIQRFGPAGANGTDLRSASQALAYSALVDPSK